MMQQADRVREVVVGGAAPAGRVVAGVDGSPDSVTAAALRRSVRDAGLDGDPGVRAETVEGVDRDVLLDVAEGADLLVVGSRGRSGWAALLLGSVALHCVTAAPCPVAVVRPPRNRGPVPAPGRTTG